MPQQEWSNATAGMPLCDQCCTEKLLIGPAAGKQAVSYSWQCQVWCCFKCQATRLHHPPWQGSTAAQAGPRLFTYNIIIVGCMTSSYDMPRKLCCPQPYTTLHHPALLSLLLHHHRPLRRESL